MLRLRKHRQKRDVLGFRLPMLSHEEPELDISEIIVMDPDNTFYMRMGSEAMTAHHIMKDNILVIDRTLKPVNNSIVVFFHEGDFYTRRYELLRDRLILHADRTQDSIVIENGEVWNCWGVVLLTLHPLIQPQHRVGRYVNVCAC